MTGRWSTNAAKGVEGTRDRSGTADAGLWMPDIHGSPLGSGSLCISTERISRDHRQQGLAKKPYDLRRSITLGHELLVTVGQCDQVRLNKGARIGGQFAMTLAKAGSAVSPRAAAAI